MEQRVTQNKIQVFRPGEGSAQTTQTSGMQREELAGEIAHISRNPVHRESNPSTEEQTGFLVRVGKGVPVFNVDSP